MQIVRIAALAALITVPGLASAEPLVGLGGKPAAAKSWSAKGNVVTLTLADGFSASEAASAIEAQVPGAKAKASGETKVVVSGVEEAKLIAALEKVEVEAALDDVNQMFSALHGADDGDTSGSSIRATSAADFSQVVKDPEARFAASVVEVKHGTYPFVAVTVKIEQLPKGVVALKKGETITVVPRIDATKGVIAKDDQRSRTNVGAWYAKKGDKVSLKLEGKTKQGFWVADRYERQK